VSRSSAAPGATGKSRATSTSRRSGSTSGVYIVCFNPERADKDRKDREAILEKLGKKLGRGSVKGHIFAAFLALYLSAMLRRRLDELWQREHPDAPPAEPPRP